MQPNVVVAIYEKICRLNELKSTMTQQYNARCKKIDEELDVLRSALQTANDAVKDVLCDRCDGTGEESFTDAAGSRDTRECHACGGTGIKPNKGGAI